MRKKNIAIALVLLMGVMSFQGCIGGRNGFVVTQKMYTWNKGVTSNKFVNELIFLVLNIIPVYGVCAVLVDGIVLNSVDFWSGSNPLAMAPGEVETKYITEDGKNYKVDVSLNRYHITQLTGPNMGEEADLIFNPETKTWLLGNGKEIKRAVQILGDKDVKVFKNDGESFIMSADAILSNADKI